MVERPTGQDLPGPPACQRTRPDQGARIRATGGRASPSRWRTSNSGFVVELRRRAGCRRRQLVDVVMGYYTGADLPVYDHLASELLRLRPLVLLGAGRHVANRLYAVAERRRKQGQREIADLPEPSFVRHLESRQDLLAVVLARGLGTTPLQRQRVTCLGYLRRCRVLRRRSFLAPRNFSRRCAPGRAPRRLVDRPQFHRCSSGPRGRTTTIRPRTSSAGQELVLKVYSALLEGPQWSKTMLVITYDEHGGFYDHVAAAGRAGRQAAPEFRTYGVRVPSIVVSPWTERASVSNAVYDHTSIRSRRA